MMHFSCQQLVELVTDYFEDALPPEDRVRFEEHVEDCSDCTTYLEQARATIAITRATRGLEQRPEITGLLEAFRRWMT
jgi:anti-sigma factor RsiW